MPSTHQAAADREVPPFPRIEREHGENPARFLVESIEPDADHGTSGELILARIEGIESLDLAHAWEAVERALAREDYLDEPRERVLDALEERQDALADDDGLAQVGLSAAELRARGAGSEYESVAILVDEEGEEVPWSRQKGAVVGQPG